MDNTLDDATAEKISADFERAWSDATFARDQGRLAALFADDIVFLGSHPRMYIGKAELREYLASNANSVPDKLTFSGRQVRVIGPNAFTTTSYITFSMKGSDGALNSFRWAISWTLADRGNGWQIVQHHASSRPAG